MSNTNSHLPLSPFSQHTCLRLEGDLWQSRYHVTAKCTVTQRKIILASYRIYLAVNCYYLDCHWELCISIGCPPGSGDFCSAVCRPRECTCTQFICVRSPGWSFGLHDKFMHTELNVPISCDALFCYSFHLWWLTCTGALDTTVSQTYRSKLTVRPQSCTQLCRK